MRSFITSCLLLAIPALVSAQNTTTQSSYGAAEDQIRNTFATEAFLLDTADTASLGQVYTETAVLNFTGGDVYSGLDEILAGEYEGIVTNNYGGWTIMHQYTMHHITVNDNATASAVSYAQWNRFGGSSGDGYVRWTWAKYFDTLVETTEGWKFQDRQINTIAGPLNTNLTVG